MTSFSGVVTCETSVTDTVYRYIHIGSPSECDLTVLHNILRRRAFVLSEELAAVVSAIYCLRICGADIESFRANFNFPKRDDSCTAIFRQSLHTLCSILIEVSSASISW